MLVDIPKMNLERLHPLKKVPVLETEQGPIFSAQAIMKYFAAIGPVDGLLGVTEED